MFMSQSLILNNGDAGVSIVIPCYQSEASLNKVVVGICDSLRNFEELSYEILLVLDGPTDKTAEIATQLEKQFTDLMTV
jgi:glycosyltransferase involved in cell wall biosynthesis